MGRATVCVSDTLIFVVFALTVLNMQNLNKSAEVDFPLHII